MTAYAVCSTIDCGSSPAGLFEQVFSHGGFMVSGIESVHLTEEMSS